MMARTEYPKTRVTKAFVRSAVFVSICSYPEIFENLLLCSMLTAGEFSGISTLGKCHFEPTRIKLKVFRKPFDNHRTRALSLRRLHQVGNGNVAKRICMVD